MNCYLALLGFSIQASERCFESRVKGSLPHSLDSSYFTIHVCKFLFLKIFFSESDFCTIISYRLLNPVKAFGIV